MIRGSLTLKRSATIASVPVTSTVAALPIIDRQALGGILAEQGEISGLPVLQCPLQLPG